jgi:membrane protein DedA with SNARE-associated domain
VNFAESVFTRWGVLAVFFGRFIALLRIFAGPLAGALKMRYPKFLAANVLGGICWATGTTFRQWRSSVRPESIACPIHLRHCGSTRSASSS